MTAKKKATAKPPHEYTDSEMCDARHIIGEFTFYDKACRSRALRKMLSVLDCDEFFEAWSAIHSLSFRAGWDESRRHGIRRKPTSRGT
jgi:hypothetical protein